MTRAKAALADLGRDTLVLGDRLYGTVDSFATLSGQGCWGLVRRNRLVGLHKRRRLRRRRHAGGLLEDWLVRAGSGVSAPAQTLRHIRWRHGGTRYEVLTNVLESARLSAEEALTLYSYRWRVERMYFDLKQVLNLNRVYAANPNAVAMQVYAAGLVYNAMRVAQGEVAEAAGVAPEEISPAKFYPKLAAACHSYVVTQLTVHDTRRLNPRTRLRVPDWRAARWASVSLEAIRVERRSDHRRIRRFCAARRHGKSFTHVHGGRKFVRLS